MLLHWHQHNSLAFHSMTTTIRHRSMCFPCILCHFLSISSENCGMREGNGKVRRPPPRKIDIAPEPPPHGENLQSIASNPCPPPYSRSDDVPTGRSNTRFNLISSSQSPSKSHHRPQISRHTPHQTRKKCTKPAKFSFKILPTIIAKQRR